jgi:basic membrane lipoprotein Med (substrate-binding protein (PBP1-ABC) superfamily)
VLVGFAGEARTRTACERLANDHVDRGADVVIADAGDCGLGALAVASARGVWGVGEKDEYGDSATRNRPMLARTDEDIFAAVELAVRGCREHTLPRGGEQALGLRDDYAVGFWFTAADAKAAMSKVVELCSDIRRHASLRRPDTPPAEASAAARNGISRGSA